MAIIKEIELDNGIILNYHRITNFSKITNISNNIEISSYINETQRNKENAYQKAQIKKANGEILTEEEQQLLDNGINVLVETDYIQIPYDADMTIEDAYTQIKTTDKYKNAEDV